MSIDLGDATLTATGDFLLNSMVANLRTRDVPATVVRRPPDVIETELTASVSRCRAPSSGRGS